MLRNADLAELLARAGEQAEGHRARAYRRAAAAALSWTIEASELAAEGRSLEELPAIGPGLATRIEGWLAAPPDVPAPPPSRSGFVTRTAVDEALSAYPEWSRAAADLQSHTDHSDGRASVAAMAAAADASGRTFLAVTDHSTGQPVPRGMDAAGAAARAEEIAACNESFAASGSSFRVLDGLECNLTIAGMPAVSAAELARFELVLGAFHSSLRTEDDQTERYLAAAGAPGVQILGHPTCRRYDTRPGLVADWRKVFAAIAAAGRAVEIDAHPHRQDLPVGLARIACEEGCYFSIGTDAHSVDELDALPFGLAIAAAAGVPQERILNLWTPAEVVAWARELRHS